MGIKDYTRCIIIYGSNSNKRSKKQTSQSDYDFLIIFKNTTPYSISSVKIEEELSIKKINFDFAWYAEDYLVELINNGIDLHLFKSIFIEGEILFSDSNFVEKIISKIKNYNPAELFFQSFTFRSAKINSLIIKYARNLSRICFDYISTLYCKFNKIEEWSNLPNFENIIIESKDLQLIDHDTYMMMERLISISKMKAQEIEKQKLAILLELLKFNQIMDEKSTLLIKDAMPPSNKHRK